MDSFKFTVQKKQPNSKARTGTLVTPHGTIQTPAFVTVGTKGTVKSLSPENIDSLKSQLIFVNTYHMVLSPGLEILKKAGGIRTLSNISTPLITDSGGFQVFSLGRQKTSQLTTADNTDIAPTLVKISEDGVRFKSPIDGREFFFTPEFSIQAQKIIGADLMVAFDECAPGGSSYNYTVKAMNRTHEWAVRSLNEAKIEVDPVPGLDQRLYGVIQGGQFEDLRKKSAEYISSLPFFGLAIGGVSVGETKQEMREQIKWVTDVIEQDLRPRHLLGIGEIDDIFDGVELGMDTMDCVTPTRHARMGRLYVYGAKDNKRKKHELDITKLIYKADLSPIDPECECYTCLTFSKSYVHHLFKERELLGYHLATMHNLFFMEKLFKEIRVSLVEDRFSQLKQKWT
jgi:tRNA-guanine transglycosylase